MHKLLATITGFLLYTCGTKAENADTPVKPDSRQASMYPYYYYPPVFYPYYPPPYPVTPQSSEVYDLDKNKPFGGDRSDHWLYPPRSYYVHWANTEEQNDWDTWDKWGQWRGWHRRPTAPVQHP